MSSLVAAIYNGLPSSVFEAVADKVLEVPLQLDHEIVMAASDEVLVETSYLDQLISYIQNFENVHQALSILIILLLCLFRFLIKSLTQPKPAPTVAVIGCGPTGMFFMHAIALRRQKMEEEGDVKGLAKLPLVTCFEKASQPGGVWRSAAEAKVNATARKEKDIIDYSPSMEEKKDECFTEGVAEESTNMYEGLWTNGLTLSLEMFDYTFDEHFKRPVLNFMPRAAILDYMLARVTRNNPNFYDSTLFDTSVDKVIYDKKVKKFIVTSTDLKTGQVLIGQYDKCLWGAGVNGKMKIPTGIKNILRRGEYKGQTMHSSEAGNCLDKFKDKRVLFIGDESSAEDLALMGCKLGLKKMYIFSRQGRGKCCHENSWPGDKVEVLYELELTGVSSDNTLLFDEAYFNPATKSYEREDNGISRKLEDIDAVIYCTGYHCNDDMLDDSLFEEEDNRIDFSVPKKWRMKKNAFSRDLGHVRPAKKLDYKTFCGMKRINYFGLCLSNPNLMFSESVSEYPLLEIDIRAWFFLGTILGEIKVPSKEEMIYYLKKDCRHVMNVHEARLFLDPNYKIAIDELLEEEDHWYNDVEDERSRALAYEEAYIHVASLLGRMMQVANYPVSFLKAKDELNEMGEQFLKNDVLSISFQERLPNPDTSEWMTFRDDHFDEYASIYTSTKTAPFKEHWIDMDESKSFVEMCLSY